MTLKIIDVGGMEVTEEKDSVLKTFVGSCIALCLYDPAKNVAGMAHVMLPTNSSKKLKNEQIPRSLQGKYADVAIDSMLTEMLGHGASPKRIRAKLAGGAKVFEHEGDSSAFDVGKSNLEMIYKLLKKHNIPIVSKDVGKSHGRWVKFVVDTKDMFIGDYFKIAETKL